VQVEQAEQVEVPEVVVVVEHLQLPEVVVHLV
jgi:hypothetical protein